MIVIDTHIWIWWVHDNAKLSLSAREVIQANESKVIGVSAISCWEIAKLIEYNRLSLPCNLEDWFAQALNYPGIELLPLTPKISIESTNLSGFHKDPADQIIVATARINDCLLITADRKILAYNGVETLT